MKYATDQPKAAPITLTVANIAQDAAFFEDLFGFVAQIEGKTALLTLPLEGYEHISLRLSTHPQDGAPPGLILLLHTPEEVLDLYLLALLQGVPSAHLTSSAGLLATAFTSPSGHIIKVQARQIGRESREPERRRHLEESRLSTRSQPARREHADSGVPRMSGATGICVQARRNGPGSGEPLRLNRTPYRGRRLGSGND